MSKMDEQNIAYLKLWLGILVVSDISLIGWLLTDVGKASDLQITGALLVVATVAFMVLSLHKRIQHLIAKLED